MRWSLTGSDEEGCFNTIYVRACWWRLGLEEAMVCYITIIYSFVQSCLEIVHGISTLWVPLVHNLDIVEYIRWHNLPQSLQSFV